MIKESPKAGEIKTKKKFAWFPVRTGRLDRSFLYKLMFPFKEETPKKVIWLESYYAHYIYSRHAGLYSNYTWRKFMISSKPDKPEPLDRTSPRRAGGVGQGQPKQKQECKCNECKC